MPRKISWIRAALKDFGKFPESVQNQMLFALRLAARGEKAETAKPFKGLGSGIFEIALPYRGAAYRAIYAVQIGEDIWVVHAFQKKSKTGIQTPKPDVDLTRKRIKRLKEELR